MAWEFWESGITKLNGKNWFADIPWAEWQKGFPFPFDQIPMGLNWFLATWGELVFAAMLLFGLFTRFAAISMIIITVGATAAVHWPAEWNSLADLWNGYVITSKGGGNFKLPLLFVVMLLPLLFAGGGKLSIDYLLVKMTGRNYLADDRTGGLQSAGLALMLLGLSLIWIEPSWGITMLVAGVLAVIGPEFSGRS